MRSALVTALASCAEESVQNQARRFLQGLSADELAFIAEFLGASILESGGKCACSRAQLAARIAEYQRLRRGCTGCPSEDQDHKMILLLEFLCRSGLQQVPMAARASA